VETPQASTAGVAIPAGRELVIVFTTAEPGSEARISPTDGAEVVVRAPQGAATFTSDVNRLTIDNRVAASTFEIAIPRSSRRVEIRVKNDRIYLKEGGRITPAAPDTGEVHVLRIAPAG
jgi:hypothetical protein